MTQVKREDHKFNENSQVHGIGAAHELGCICVAFVFVELSFDLQLTTP